MKNPLRLTRAAQATLVSLQCALDELGLTPDQARALLLAPEFVKEVNEPEEPFNPPSTTDEAVQALLSFWGEDGWESWRDVLCEVPTFVTDRAVGDEPEEE